MFAIFRKITNGSVYDEYYKSEENAIKAIEHKFAHLTQIFDVTNYEKDTSFNAQKGFTNYQYTIYTSENDTIVLALIEGHFQDNNY